MKEEAKYCRDAADLTHSLRIARRETLFAEAITTPHCLDLQATRKDSTDLAFEHATIKIQGRLIAGAVEPRAPNAAELGSEAC
jgi:hypothetical protein